MTWTGTVRLGFVRRQGRTVACDQFSSGALKVMRPTYEPGSPTPHWTLMNPGGGYLDGDRYHIDIRLAPGSDAVIDGQAATKIYRCEREEGAYQRSDIRLDPGSILWLRPRPLIAYRDSRYTQETVVAMHPAARLFSREIVTAGWSPDGSEFAFGSLRTRLRVSFDDGRLALIDNLVVEPGVLDPRSPTVLGRHTHLGTLAVVGQAGSLPPVSTIRKACLSVADESRCRIGIGGAPGVCVVVRCLGESTETIENVLNEAERALCPATTRPGREASERLAEPPLKVGQTA